MTYCTLSADDTWTTHEGTPTGDDLNRLVGGYFDVATVRDGILGALTVWMWEDAKRHHLPVNRIATDLLHQWRRIRPDDYVAGTVVFTGGATAQGDTLPLTDLWLARFIRLGAPSV